MLEGVEVQAPLIVLAPIQAPDPSKQLCITSKCLAWPPK